jgi:hypothetical protein
VINWKPIDSQLSEGTDYKKKSRKFDVGRNSETHFYHLEDPLTIKEQMFNPSYKMYERCNNHSLNVKGGKRW